MPTLLPSGRQQVVFTVFIHAIVLTFSVTIFVGFDIPKYRQIPVNFDAFKLKRSVFFFLPHVSRYKLYMRNDFCTVSLAVATHSQLKSTIKWIFAIQLLFNIKPILIYSIHVRKSTISPNIN